MNIKNMYDSVGYYLVIMIFLVLGRMYFFILLMWNLIMVCFEYWEFVRCDISRGFKCVYVVGFGFLCVRDLIWEEYVLGGFCFFSLGFREKIFGVDINLI